jgi:5'-phosphate synthase pdxT subunit
VNRAISQGHESNGAAVANHARVGVLALQGDFAAHTRALAARDLIAVEVRSGDALEGLAGLVLPGGESTTMLNLMQGTNLAARLMELIRAGVPVLATCAGVILLAREVHNPAQRSLGVLDIAVARNAYGRQIDSAVVPLEVVDHQGLGNHLEGVFIRAPRITRVGAGVDVLALRDDDPVLVRQGRIVAATFHPELSPGSPVLDLFAHLVRSRQ